MYEALIVLAVASLAQMLKQYVYPKWGSVGMQVVVFLVALGFSTLYYVAQASPSFMAIVATSGQVLLLAVGVYEILLKRLGFPSGKDLV
jgi:hypothetical protein